MWFSTLILRNLTRRRYRSILTLLALSTAIACVIALLGVANGFKKSFAEVYSAHQIDIVVTRQGAADRLSSSVDENMASRIGELPEIQHAGGVLLETLSLEEKRVYGIPTMGISKGSWMFNDFRLRDGAPLGSQGTDASLWLGVHLADRTGAKVGEFVQVFEQNFLVEGIFESTSVWENGSMILPLNKLQELTDRQGQVTYINVMLDHSQGKELGPQAVKAIQDLDVRLLPLATGEFVKSDTRMQIASAMAWMTSVIALVIGAIGTLNTMMTSVLERTKEIGILRAIGWPRSKVILMIMLESCGLAFVACLLGSGLAMALTWGLSQSSEAKGLLQPTIDVVTFLEGWGMGLGIGLLGAWIPAWHASQLLPTKAFRNG